MPLYAYAPFFSAHEVDVMSLAFNAAWQELTASSSSSIGGEQIETLRAKLAECIVISALDISAEEPEKLAQEALRCLHENHFMNQPC